MLGRSAPDQTRDGRTTVCAAGWSPSLGFVRIYPTTLQSDLQAWNIVSVPVERNPADSRAESWKIQGSKREWDNLHRKIEVHDSLPPPRRHALVKKLARDCPTDLNNRRVSLGVVRPVELKWYLGDRPDVDETVQRTLWGSTLPKTKINFAVQPRLEYRCSSCEAKSLHDQQLIEIGCYQWFTKNPGREEQVFRNMHLSDPGWSKYLFVGNLANHRTSYVVISVLWWKRAAGGDQAVLFETQ
jgi:hypothetical protein